MTKYDTPRDGSGAKLCAWCGSPVEQPATGRSRDYCRRSCRQRAYEERLVAKRIAEAVEAHQVSSRDQQGLPTPESARDESVRAPRPQRKPQVVAPARPPAPRPTPTVPLADMTKPRSERKSLFPSFRRPPSQPVLFDDQEQGED
ncbi:hypothetical protein ACFY7C_37490 [Streptomyces sp. NPDC012769]|uniref:hypothetical protein n=1 Tax=Streptomyces sp. NPDC012769 TaxID=3364848 RepID=UPI00368C7F1B